MHRRVPFLMHPTLSAEYIYASKGMSIGIIQRHTVSERDECANRIDIDFSAMLKTITRLVNVFQCHYNLRQNKKKDDCKYLFTVFFNT